MFKKILVPLDLTDRHGPALQIAAELAGPAVGELIMLHVIEVIPGLPMEEEKSFYGRLERSAKKHLERMDALLAGRPVTRRGEIRLGNRYQEITRYAGELGADLIVLTARRIDPENPAAGWGSLSWKLSIMAPCAVLLVK
jgi:nucleotide-binding universal stress UspA family protein